LQIFLRVDLDRGQGPSSGLHHPQLPLEPMLNTVGLRKFKTLQAIFQHVSIHIYGAIPPQPRPSPG